MASSVPRSVTVPKRIDPGASGLWMAVLSAAAFGASGPFAKSLLEKGWSPGAAVLVRIGGAAIILAPAAIRAWRRNPPGPSDRRIIVAYGVTSVAGTQLSYFSAVQTLSVGVALLIEYLAPVLLVGYAWLGSRRAPGRRTLIGSAVSMVGLVLVLDIGGVVDVDPVGVAWGLAAAVCLSLYFLLSAKVTNELPPVLLAGGGLAVGSFALGAAGLVGALPLRASTADVTLMGTPTTWVLPALELVVISTAIAYMTGIIAAGKLGSRVASFVGLTEVLFAVAVAWLLLDELPAGVQLLGGVCILIGVILVRTDRDHHANPDHHARTAAGGGDLPTKPE